MDLIVVLERTSVSPDVVSYVLRASVPAARQPYFADPTKTSAYKQASAQDLTDLRDGKYLELVESLNIAGLSAATLRALVIGRQGQFQAAVTADGIYNPWKFYGTKWNGSAWTPGGVD